MGHQESKETHRSQISLQCGSSMVRARSLEPKRLARSWSSRSRWHKFCSRSLYSCSMFCRRQKQNKPISGPLGGGDALVECKQASDQERRSHWHRFCSRPLHSRSMLCSRRRLQSADKGFHGAQASPRADGGSCNREPAMTIALPCASWLNNVTTITIFSPSVHST